MVRICDQCGLPVLCGMTNDWGDFYVHEGECFQAFMDRCFGRNKWMSLGGGKQDGLGGFYVAASDFSKSGIESTGIYYTEWEEDGDEDNETVVSL